VSGVSLVEVAASDEVAAIASLFEADAASLPVDLGYQDFATELGTLPGKYAPPGGALFLARDGAGAAIGCVGLRPLADGCCEMKRLYVAPAARGLGLGRLLVDAVLAAAVSRGYGEIRLDTLPTMGEALALYRRLGFVDIAPYYEGAPAGTRFLARPLR
jgi:ribosomal protein S18 acetylase RimI-like enzyme